jgi:hypothetical protein
MNTKEATPPGSQQQMGMRPSAADFRTAARVLRYMTNLADRQIDELPPMRRWWKRLWIEDSAELHRKSSLLESVADEMEGAHTDPDQRPAR